MYHHFSVKHLDRYVTEFQGRHNGRPLDTADQMGTMVRGAVGKRLTYDQLITAANFSDKTMTRFMMHLIPY